MEIKAITEDGRLEEAAKVIRASFGIVNEQEVLKSWYKGLGFTEKETRSYPHLPFTVCFMEKELP